MSHSEGDVPEGMLSGPFRGSRARRLGITGAQLAGPRFRRIHQDVYAPASTGDSLELRCHAAELVLPDDAVFCGATAARLYGLPVPRRDQDVHVAVPAKLPTAPRIKELRIHQYTIPPEQTGTYGGWRVVKPERLFLELAHALDRFDLIAAGDQMLRRGHTTIDRLTGFLHGCDRRRGVKRARDAVPLLDGRADSPPESRARILLTDAGLPRPVVNQDVVNAWGIWLARPDLSYPELKIAIQYEGGHHQSDPAQYAYDIERDGRLIDEGWTVIRLDKNTLYNHPEIFVARIRRALARRSA
ncbi:hypothetical protein [Actinomadura sp. 21ATH]|uniref:hypothetical protein n=1 Tax=Actinomadura sp. 21ATH TaxID=1735444 RepID=UPI0035BF01E0